VHLDHPPEPIRMAPRSSFAPQSAKPNPARLARSPHPSKHAQSGCARGSEEPQSFGSGRAALEIPTLALREKRAPETKHSPLRQGAGSRRSRSVDIESRDVTGRPSKAQVGTGRRRSGPHARIVANTVAGDSPRRERMRSSATCRFPAWEEGRYLLRGARAVVSLNVTSAPAWIALVCARSDLSGR
jgi:hypothetical protein